jgi:hypothetical protein
MTLAMPGILAIWNDVESAAVPAYEHWIVSEHIPERLALPGFLEARRYEAVEGGLRFFIPYLTESPEALASPEYLARLAAPTPQTREIMPAFRNMTRSVCTLAYRSPREATGGNVVTGYVLEPSALDAAALLEEARTLERDPRVLGVQVWRAVPGAAASSEAKLRPGGDRRIEAALVVDVAREREGAALEETVRSALRDCIGGAGREEAPIHVDTYRLLGVWRASVDRRFTVGHLPRGNQSQ